MKGQKRQEAGRVSLAVAEEERPFPVVRVSIFFTVLVLLLNLLQWLILIPDYMWRLQLLTAQTTGWLIGLSGVPLTISGVEIFLPGNLHWEVTPECTALSAVIVFAAFVLVYPASLTVRGGALLVGIPFLFIANIVRLVGLAWVARFVPRQVDWFHDYVWQVAFLLLVVMMWLTWIEWWVKREA